MNDMYLEHPDITETLKNGYTSWNRPEYYYCCKCGEELNPEEVYEDFGYDYLCEDCLLGLHKKEF